MAHKNENYSTLKIFQTTVVYSIEYIAAGLVKASWPSAIFCANIPNGQAFLEVIDHTSI